jgi:hypothetical protein
MMDSQRFSDDDQAPGSLASKQMQLNQLAEGLALVNQLPNPTVGALGVPHEELVLTEAPSDVEATPSETVPASPQDRLGSLVASQSVPFDNEALFQRLSELEADMRRHSDNVTNTQALERFQSVQIEGHPLPDMTVEDVKSWIGWYKEQGNFQAAEVLAQAYDDFLRELNQKAIEGHLFRQKQDEFKYLATELEWRQVEDEFLKTVPELKAYADEIIDAVRERYNSDPMAPFLNKFVLVRDAIEALGIGSRLVPNSGSSATSLPPDAQVRSRRVSTTNLEGQKNYRLSDLKAMDYRKMTTDDLADLQNAMFEGRILTDE